ncbi:SMG8 protein [Nymphaea thermarum]|nr:SMG8 protein [Nymphaea thermarum]
MEHPASSTPLRVLVRPPPPPPPSSSSSSSAASSSSHSLPPNSTQPNHTSSVQNNDGVIVIGLIGRDPDEATQLLNRILDANVFGSGKQDIDIHADLRNSEKDGGESISDWFRSRRISYYFEKEKGIVFLLLSTSGRRHCASGSAFEECESDDLRGILVLFLVVEFEGLRLQVCHVIMFLNEGSHFDTNLLKKFRLLQSAKHALAPFVKSQITIPKSSSSSSFLLSSSEQANLGAKSSNKSPSRAAATGGRHAASVSLMSGSYSSLFPGQCAPVLLFIFVDDFADCASSGLQAEDQTDELSSANQSGGPVGLLRGNVSSSPSTSVVMLSRPASKSEGGFRKKLQSSLDGHLRFLIKKCRPLSGGATEGGHSGSSMGSRGIGHGGSGTGIGGALFSIDATRAVALLERSTNHKGESLNFVTDLIDQVLEGKASLDVLHPENNSHNPYKEDLLLDALVSVKHNVVKEKEDFAFESDRSGDMSRPIQSNRKEVTSSGRDAVHAAISCLEGGKGLNMKFSVGWCQKALPAAIQVYMGGLPPCYPTTVHEEHLEKALRAFFSMVKGSAVQMFSEKLKEECNSIWKSGRRLCDAVSLTGRLCMHQKHRVEHEDPTSLVSQNSTICDLDVDEKSDASLKKHCSGFVFLHACACGRSRRIRDDPFDFESANVSFNHFPDCENMLPSLSLPTVTESGPVKTSAWSLIRLGGSRYYEPTKGLVQSGFCKTRKFLSICTIAPNRQGNINGFSMGSTRKEPMSSSSKSDPKIQSVPEVVNNLPLPVEGQKKGAGSISSGDQRISFGRGLPILEMKKPFTTAITGTLDQDSAFPPLQQRKQSGTGMKQNVEKVQKENESPGNAGNHWNLKRNEVPIQEDSQSHESACQMEDSPFLQIGSNVVPVFLNGSKKVQPTNSLKHAIVYIGFEHECPHGHRFLLSTEHLELLGAPYSSSDDAITSSIENSQSQSTAVVNQGKGHKQEKVHLHTVRMEKPAVNRSKGMILEQDQLKEHGQSLMGSAALPRFWKDFDESLQDTIVNDGTEGCILLNRDLPIYMKCPYCGIAKSKKRSDVNFAGMISQLQRIFLVTPPFPTVLATCPLVQFEASLLPTSVHDRESQSCFSLGSQVILPPESFVTLRLPFVYGVQLNDGVSRPLQPSEHRPESTAWICKGTVLQRYCSLQLDC